MAKGERRGTPWTARAVRLVAALVAVALIVLITVLVEMRKAPEPEMEAVRLVQEGPPDLMRHRETFRTGIEALQENEGLRAVIALRSFSFDPRPAEEYRLYYLANAYQLVGDVRNARQSLAALWQRQPRMVLREDAGFNLAALYTAAGDWAGAASIEESIIRKAHGTAVQAAARDELIRSAFYLGDPGAMLVASRAAVVDNPTAPTTEDRVDLIRALRSIPRTEALPLTLEERLHRAERILEDGEPERALNAISNLDPEAMGSPARERALLLRGSIRQKLGRLDEAEEDFSPLFSSWYKFAIPAIEHSAQIHRTLSRSKTTTRLRTVTKKVRSGTHTVRRKGKSVTVPSYKFVSAEERVKVKLDDKERKKEEAIWIDRLRDLLSLPASRESRLDALGGLIEWAEQANEDSLLRDYVARFVALDPLEDPALQRIWDQGWEAFEKRHLDEAELRFRFIADTYHNPNVIRQARYWLARSLELGGKKDAANAIYQELASAPYDDLYGLFVRQRGIPGVVLAPASPDPGETDWVEIAEREMPDELRLAYDLEVLGLPREARQELQLNASPANRHYADAILSDLFLSQGQHVIASRYMKKAFPALATVQQDSVPLHFLRNYYVLRYEDTIRRYATERNLDPTLIMALILQESGFDATARSGVGATGLMQLMPATAREIGGKLYTVFTESRLENPDVNVNLGTYYIRQLIDLMDGDVELAVAGYNGGPYRVKRLRAKSKVPRDEFIEGLPMSETRNYVKRITILRSSYQKLEKLLR